MVATGENESGRRKGDGPTCEADTSVRVPAPKRDAASSVSFEFFPPKTAAGETQLRETIAWLETAAPDFVSVTNGAAGTSRDRTYAMVLRIRRETALEPAAHLTCLGTSRQEIDDIASRYWRAGVRRIVALRGDPPAQAVAATVPAAGYEFAADLVAGLRRIAPFEISVAAYPETHPEAQSAEADLDNLKRKIDAGADRAITQFFLDPAIYLRFRDRAYAAGLRAPIVPGVLPVTDFGQATKFAARCGASVPSWLARRFDGLENHPEVQRRVGAAAATDLCRTLQSEGVRQFHFYTLNRAEVSLLVCRALGLSTSSSSSSAPSERVVPCRLL